MILGFTLIINVESFLEKDVVKGAAKAAIEESIKRDENITAKEKELIEEILGDSESSSMVSMIIDNYFGYKNDQNFSISKADFDKLHAFALKYKDKLKELAASEGETFDEEGFDKFFTYEEINKYASEAFENMSKEVDDAGMETVVDVYDKLTTGSFKLIAIFSIIFCIVILGLINWSLFRWMPALITALVVTGVLMIVIYVLANILLNNIEIKDLSFIPNFSRFLISGIIEVVLGIIFIVVYEILKKKYPKNEVYTVNN